MRKKTVVGWVEKNWDVHFLNNITVSNKQRKGELCVPFISKIKSEFTRPVKIKVSFEELE